MNLYNDSDFIALLASLMDERAVSETELIKKISDFNKIAKEDLKDAITSSKEINQNVPQKTTVYSDTPMLLQRLDDFTESMTNLALCREIHDKALIYINSSTFSDAIKNLKDFCDSTINNLAELDITVPVLICDGESLCISCMTYSDKRIEFSEADFFKLIFGAKSNNIDLNAIIKYVVIKVPFFIHDYVFLTDNSEHTAEKLFKGYISKSLSLKDETFFSTINSDYIKSYYGLHFRFHSIVEPVLAFYQNKINSCKEMVKNITDDLIKLSGGNATLHEMRKTIQERRDSLKKQLERISGILIEMDGIVTTIEKELNNTFTTCAFVIPTVILYILELIITNCEAGSFKAAEKYYDQLAKTQYKHLDIVSDYIYYTKNREEVVFPYADANKKNDWRIIKMIIAISDISDYNNDYMVNILKKWIKIIDEHISTPKEKYAKGITLPEDDLIRNDYLKESFMGNYAPAGQLLWEEAFYNEDDIERDFLADLLQPEACIEKGDEDVKINNGFFLNEHSFLYYKLAASTGSTEAVKKIVDRIYKKQFENLPDKATIDSSLERKRDLNALIPLCSYLIDQGVSPARYNKIQGVLFYLKNNHIMAMSKLAGDNTQIANYCKGQMYEHEWGTAVDLDQALIHYNKSGSFKDSLIRISNLKSMIQKKKEEETKSTTYSSSSNYSSTKSNYHSSSGCFITTAAVKNICATDDCAELEIMRNFRDSFINKTDIGQSLTLEYYRVAPIIVQHIDNDPDCDKIYQNIWQNYITQSLICIKNGEKKRAQIIYINMVQMLAEKYGVEVKEDIVKKYLCSIADE